ncbi:Holliday junction resolvase RuvX [Corynebacterium pseudopelargi]|uniref:Putative pre-16S rRNA nuclease n=1 Tax=Corynebacterium pseudopelargi TaxID=2080757 RepID=A0A3G6IYX2_9CORY|nr:Holliday junction resolvase RuvX [Corynebacterium pseudopelargi]AZA09174.1 Putative Holliday junction resolvase [Corynebacterium pseudopelargi]
MFDHSPQPDRPGIADPGPGRRLGIDVGTVRIGIAVSDSDARLATPVETVARVTGFRDEDGADIERIIQLIQEYQVKEVIVGLPRTLAGQGSASAQHAQLIAKRLQGRVEKLKQQGVLPKGARVQLGDERLSTVVATQAMRSSGVSAKKARSRIDQAAAVEILQSWLDERASAMRRQSPKPGPRKGIVKD